MKKHIIFIMNPISGTSEKKDIPALIESVLDHDKYTYDIKLTQYAGHASEIATEAKNNNVDIVVAVGGDGTVNEVARALVHSSTALAILPCGSGNGLARHLLLPMNIKTCIEYINMGEIHDLDYGIINDKPFFCTCGMGFDAFISKKFAEAGKRGVFTYIENVIKEGFQYQPETYEITTENETFTQKAFLISCANASQYGNNAYIAPQASMSDGLLDVVIMEPMDIMDGMQIPVEMINKTINKNSHVKTFKCNSLHVKRKTEGVIHYDGDPAMTSAEVNIKVVERGIRIVVNPEGDKSLRKPNAVQNATSGVINEINHLRERLDVDRRNMLAFVKIMERKAIAYKKRL